MNEEWQLIEGYLDGELTADEERRLAEWLAADREHLRQFVRETQLHRQIREAMLARQFQADALAVVERAERNLPPSLARSLLNPLARLLALPWSPGLRRAWLPLAACLLLFLGIGTWFLGPAMGEPVLAELTTEGVTLERADRAVAVAVGTPLQAADVVRTDTNATAAITFGVEKTKLVLAQRSELRFASIARGKRFDLRAGKLESTVARQRVLRPMIITTPNAEARVLGTRFTLTAAITHTRLDVTEGIVRLTRSDNGRDVRVNAGSYAIVAADHPLAALPITGKVLREVWRNVQGSDVHDLPLQPGFPDRPDQRDFPEGIETVKETNSTFGVRLRGYLIPQESDDYAFILSASGAAALWLSEDDSPVNRVEIAQTRAKATPDASTRRAFEAIQRQSAPVRVERGRRYYFEVLHVQVAGQGQPDLRVVWAQHGQAEKGIPPECFAPFVTEEGAQQ